VKPLCFLLIFLYIYANVSRKDLELTQSDARQFIQGVVLIRFRTASFSFITLVIVFVLVVSLFSGCAAGIFKKEELPVIPPTPDVVSENGMIVCAHPEAAKVGMDVLQNGGNAVDAAVAALLALNVVEPNASGLGGGGFLGIKMAGQEPVYLNYREKSPMEVDSSFYYQPEDSNRVAMQEGATSVCVPGTPKALSMIHGRYGKRDFKDLILPAIGLTQGFQITKGLSGQITSHYEDILNDPAMSQIFLNDSLPLQENDVMTQLDLANTFNQLRDHGLDYFYDSTFCNKMVESLRAGGSAVTVLDFRDYDAHWVEPLRGTYRGYEIVTVPPPSAGGVALIEIMNILENFELSDYEYASVEYIHLVAEAMKQGYADFTQYVSDPDFVDIPLNVLLSKDYAASRAKEIPEEIVRSRVPFYEPPDSKDGNTTHLVTIDAEGNIVTATQSLNYFFGSGMMIPGMGIIMNNEMSDFTWVSGYPNSIEGGKRPKSNMTPTIVFKDGEPFLILGTPGGSRITSAMVQILVNVIDFGMTITDAIDAPRFHPVREHLVMENRFSSKVMKKLKKKGHVLHVAGPLDVYFGGAHAILIDAANGTLNGGADPRRDGKALGY
jgi:gamma-glutamyltranspeptidase/glutathione hydrolase